MAVLGAYMSNAVDAGGWQAMASSAPGTATAAAGWVVGTGSTLHSELAANTERASSTFTATTAPDGTLDTSLKDALRWPAALTGAFASGTWTVTVTVIGTVQTGAADGRARVRLIRANADGSSATELTGAQQQCSLATNVGTTEIATSVTFNPGAFRCDGQYLFVQLAWERTGAGGMTTSNIRLRVGSTGTRVQTADFVADAIGTGTLALDAATVSAAATTPPLTAAAAITLGVLTLATAGALEVQGTAALTLDAATLTGEGEVVTPGAPVDIALVWRSTPAGTAAGANGVDSAAHVMGAGHLFVALFTLNASGTFGSCSDLAGNTWLQAGSEVTLVGNKFRTYYCFDSLGHAANIVSGTATGSPSFFGLVVLEFEGVDTLADPLVDFDSATGTDATMGTPPLDVATAQTLIVASLLNAGNSMTAGPGFTLTAFNLAGDGTAYFADEWKVVTTSQNAAASGAATSWGMTGATFRGAVDSGLRTGTANVTLGAATVAGTGELAPTGYATIHIAGIGQNTTGAPFTQFVATDYENLVLAWVYIYNGGTPAPTFAGVAMEQIAFVNGIGGDALADFYLFALRNVPAGSSTLNPATAGGYLGMTVLAYEGVGALPSLISATTTTGNNTATLSPTVPGSWVSTGADGYQANEAPAGGAGISARMGDFGGTTIAGDSAGPVDAPYSTTWLTNFQDVQQIAVVLEPASTGGVGTAAITLGAATLTADGEVEVGGSAAITLGTITLTTDADLASQGTAAITLGSITLTTDADLASQGTAAITVGPVTVTGDADLASQGTATITLGVLTVTGDADLLVGGTAALTLGAIMLTTEADLVVGGSAAITLGAATLTADADLEVGGTAALTLGALTLSSEAGSFSNTGTLAVTLDPATLTASSGTLVGGQLSRDLDPLTVTTDADLASQATAAITLGELTLSASGSGALLPIAGDLAVTLGPVTLTTDADLASQGTAAFTLGALTLTTDADLAIGGTAALTLGAVTLTTDADLASQGSAAFTLGALTLTSEADAVAGGTAAITLGPATLSGTGGVLANTGTLAVTLGPATLTGSSASSVGGQLTRTLGALTLTTDADLAIQGAATSGLGAATLTASALSGRAGSLTAAVGPASLSAAGGVAVRGSAAITLGPVTLSSSASTAVRGGAALTLGPVTLTGSGTVVYPGEGTPRLFDLIAIAELPTFALDAGPLTPPAFTLPATGALRTYLLTAQAEVSMPAEPQALACYRGEPLQLNFTLTPAADVTGWTMRFTLAALPNMTEKLYTNEVTVLDETIGALRVDLPSVQTDRTPGTYWWDVWRIDGGSERLMAIGYVVISPDVRLPAAA